MRNRAASLLLSVVASVLLVACTTTAEQQANSSSPEPTPGVAVGEAASSPTLPPTVRSSVHPPYGPRLVRQILIMLDEADQAMADKRLTTPDNYNALSFYRRVLMLAPDNREARLGLARIIERYIQWSDAALTRGDVLSARQYLDRAATVNADDPSLVEARQRLERAPVQQGDFIPLDILQLQARSITVTRQLQQIADRVRDLDARVIIQVPNDRMGRWVYQQMNLRHEEYRVRANLQLESVTGIRLLYPY